MQLHNCVRQKKFVCHDSGQNHKTFFTHVNMISSFKEDICLCFLLHFSFSIINSKIFKKKVVVFGVGQNCFYIFLLFSDKTSIVFKLSAINK